MFKTFLLIATFLGPNDEFEFTTLTELSGATTCNRKAEELNALLPESFEVFCQIQETPFFQI